MGIPTGMSAEWEFLIDDKHEIIFQEHQETRESGFTGTKC